ncbi:LytTR family transcriptional regulator DNA-binding domain-containing protein [Paenibacillus elgii]|uniref:LytTR family transcriptional regulator DNA-binding domain-containing protein n=1 Tax=Paenibacillus elgii TaxID=189691 RepID=UPI00203DFC58|nr:LytTR family transcriptional regulator DNA-binding domain-containing protein [Paenibacillus elgii]MCM3270881.1 LytTR family transcriptional regulator DNA-binding domain-containing protein [Paenibacillus elgii]
MEVKSISDAIHKLLISNQVYYADSIQPTIDFIQSSTIQLIDESGKLTHVLVKEILYAESVDGKSFFYTYDKVFTQIYGYEETLLLFKDYNFDTSHRNVVINLDLIKKFDSELLWVYFDDEVSDSSRKARMKYVYKSIVTKILGSKNDVNYIQKNSHKEIRPKILNYRIR